MLSENDIDILKNRLSFDLAISIDAKEKEILSKILKEIEEIKELKNVNSQS